MEVPLGARVCGHCTGLIASRPRAQLDWKWWAGFAVAALGTVATCLALFSNSIPNESLDRIDQSVQIVTAAINQDTVRNQLLKIEALVEVDPSSKQYAINAIKDYFNGTFDASGNASRAKRRRLIESIKRLSDGDLASQFPGATMVSADIVRADLSEADLSHINFTEAFLIETSFRSSNLNGASFLNGWIRNVDLFRATVVDTDFTGADWFNALGLKPSQFESAKRGTIAPCPSSEDPVAPFAGFHEYLGANYAFEFETWAKPIQDDLLAAWEEYSSPGGLCDLARHAKGKPR